VAKELPPCSFAERMMTKEDDNGLEQSGRGGMRMPRMRIRTP
jgi:hypothetical protein